MSSTIRTALALTALLSLAACQAKPDVSKSEAKAAPAAAGQPALWRIEVMNGAAVASRLDICADEAVRASFARPAPEVNGEPCLRTKPATEAPGAYDERCRIGEDLYAVSSATKGDPARDFTVEMAVTRQGQSQPTYQQIRHYRRVGACPTGWRIAEAAAPGDTTLRDTLTGARRPLPPATN